MPKNQIKIKLNALQTVHAVVHFLEPWISKAYIVLRFGVEFPAGMKAISSNLTNKSQSKFVSKTRDQMKVSIFLIYFAFLWFHEFASV